MPAINIREFLLREIPDEPAGDEALIAIESIVATPRKGRLTCHLAHKFVIEVEQAGNAIVLCVPGFKTVTTTPADFLPTLRKLIYATDEAISDGTYHYKEPSCFVFPDRPPPPEDMDIPVWDEKRGRWYDAEY